MRSDEDECVPLRYGFTLGNGTNWSIGISSDLTKWGEEFATILGLCKSPQASPNRILYCTEREKRSCQSWLYSGSTGQGDNVRVSLDAMEIIYHPRNHDYICILPCQDKTERKNPGYEQMAAALFPLYNGTVASGGLVLHSALLHHPRMGGIAIPAPGGTGKSTCSQRIPPPWSPCSDDLMLVVKDTHQTFHAHPLPTWSNFLLNRTQQRRWQLHSHTPIRGLFFLQKAGMDSVIPLARTDAAQWIYDSSMQILLGFTVHLGPAEQIRLKRQLFDNACDLAQQIPSGILKATPDGCFWEEIEKFLQSGRNNMNGADNA